LLRSLRLGSAHRLHVCVKPMSSLFAFSFISLPRKFPCSSSCSWLEEAERHLPIRLVLLDCVVASAEDLLSLLRVSFRIWSASRGTWTGGSRLLSASFCVSSSSCSHVDQQHLR
jgi:hypothetical protein